MYKKLKLVESASDRYQVREFDGPGAKFGVYDTKEKKFVQKGPKYIMIAACDDLNNKNKKLKESSTEEYWDATELDRDGFTALLKFNFGTDSRGNNYIITKDAYDLKRFHANNDEDAKNYFRGYLNLEKDNFGDYSTEDDETLKNKYHINESQDLTEADEDEEELEDIQDDVKEDLENQKELEDTIDSEEDQEENPVEEESELDTQLNELRDILVDLDLKLYQITDKEDLNNSVYIIGKVADDSNDVLMLVDTKPEEVNSEEIPDEEPIINNVDVDTDIEEDEEVEVEDTEKETELEQRFDFVKLPNSFEEVNKLNPRYGEGLTPDHEAITEYLMNCLVEMNPEAAEELQKEEEPEETPMEEPDYDVDLGIDIEGEEDLDSEDQY